MTIIDILQKKLDALELSDFFYEISEELTNLDLIVIEPHKMTGNIFYSLVGTMGNKVTKDEYTIDIIDDKDFIRIATMELTVLKDGVSLFFSVNFDSIFSYITYGLLNDKTISVVETEVSAGYGAFLPLVKNVQSIRNRVDKSIEITKKRLRKSYLAKCDIMNKMSDKEITEIDSPKVLETVKHGWIQSIKTLRDFIEGLE